MVEFSFNLEEKVVSEGGLEATPDLGIEKVGHEFVVPLPKTKVKVGVKLLNGIDEKTLSSLTEKKKKHKLPETTLTDQLKAIIISVNGIAEPAVVADFVDVMPALDSKFLRTVYSKLIPDIDLTQEFTCGTCMHVEDLEVPFTTDFFWFK